MRHLAGAAGPPDGAYDADVVILALDRAADTMAAIRSALAQTGASRHVFVVDQGSSPETLGRLGSAVSGRTDATLVTLGHNHGVAGGRNAGAALGRGRMIVGLDNDAAFDGPDVVARAVAALDAEPDLAAIGLRILADASGADDLSSWGYPLALLERSADRFDAATFVGAGHAIRRAAWDQAGGYDPALFFCWEEYDFCLRAIDRGWRIAYRGDIAVRHKASAERRIGWSGRRWFQHVRNRLYIERKWGASWAALAPRCAAYLARGASNGMPRLTLAAIMRAAGMPLPPTTAMSARAAAYLARTDEAHRGGLARRLRREVFAPLHG